MQLLHEHNDLGLASLEQAKKNHWSTGKRIAFSKRAYIFNHLCSLSKGNRIQYSGEEKTEQERRMDAAIIMDRERGEMSLTKYLKYLKDADSGTKKRKRK